MRDALPPGTPNEPVSPAGDGRIHTEALDLGAVLAIDRAARGARLAGPDASAPALPAPAAVVPSESAAPPPITSPRVDPIVCLPDREPGSRIQPVEAVSTVAEPSARAIESARTIEIDYSPASRLQRTRSVKVQRIARFVVIGAVTATLGLGLWKLLSGGRAGTPLAAHPLETTPAVTVTAQAPAATIPAAVTAQAPAATPPAAVTSATPTVAIRPANSAPPTAPTTPAPRPKPKARPVATSEFPNQ